MCASASGACPHATARRLLAAAHERLAPALFDEATPATDIATLLEEEALRVQAALRSADAGRLAALPLAAALALSGEQEFGHWLTLSTILHGWALVVQGHGEEGMGQMRQGMAAWRAVGSEAVRPYFLGLFAEACGHLGHDDEGLEVLAEALGLTARSGEGFWQVELYRLQGELLLARSPERSAEVTTCFHQALTVAQRQQTRLLELRAAMSLGRLLQRQGRPAEARQRLGQVYDWFTEGFASPDLQEAKTLLEELA